MSDPITKQRSLWREEELNETALALLSEVQSDPRFFVRNVHDGYLRALIAEEPLGWHLSISSIDHKGNPKRYPTWDEIADARYELLPSDLDFVMHLPPPDDYVAVHKTTFHLHEFPERVTPPE